MTIENPRGAFGLEVGADLEGGFSTRSDPKLRVDEHEQRVCDPVPHRVRDSAAGR